MSKSDAKKANILYFMPASLVRRRLRDGAYVAQCPFHADDTPSMNLSLKKSGWVWYCHPCGEGGDAIKFAQKLYGVPFGTSVDILCGNLPHPPAVGMADRSSIAPQKSDSKSQKSETHAVNNRKMVEAYDYGMYRKVRYEPKGFAIQHWSTEWKEWRAGMGGAEPCLYVPGSLMVGEIFVVEGEKAADVLWERFGLCAVAAGGANAWRPEFARRLIGNDVIILPDNDKPGERYMESVCASLPGCAKVIRLPGLPPGGDVYDWIQAGGTREQLLYMVDNCKFTQKDLQAQRDLCKVCK